MLNDPRSLVDEQASASRDVPGEHPQAFEAAEMMPRHARLDPLLGPLLWITPSLALIAVLALSAI
jgi:hypothetical protein